MYNNINKQFPNNNQYHNLQLKQKDTKFQDLNETFDLIKSFNSNNDPKFQDLNETFDQIRRNMFTQNNHETSQNQQPQFYSDDESNNDNQSNQGKSDSDDDQQNDDQSDSNSNNNTSNSSNNSKSNYSQSNNSQSNKSNSNSQYSSSTNSQQQASSKHYSNQNSQNSFNQNQSEILFQDDNNQIDIDYESLLNDLNESQIIQDAQQFSKASEVAQNIGVQLNDMEKRLEKMFRFFKKE